MKRRTWGKATLKACDILDKIMIFTTENDRSKVEGFQTFNSPNPTFKRRLRPTMNAGQAKTKTYIKRFYWIMILFDNIWLHHCFIHKDKEISKAQSIIEPRWNRFWYGIRPKHQIFCRITDGLLQRACEFVLCFCKLCF